jgi:DNA replication protein DnaC
MSDALLHGIQFQLFYLLRENNDIYSIAMSGLTILLLSYYEVIFNFLSNNLHQFIPLRKNKVIIEGIRYKHDYRKRHDDFFSTRFRAIWYYIQSNNFNSDIKSLKEYTSIEYTYDRETDSDIQTEEHIFIVNQTKPFKLNHQIDCRIYINENSFNDDKNNKAQTSTEKITIELYSSKINVKNIKNFVDNITTDFENKIENFRKDKLFTYMLFQNENKNFYWNEYEFISNKNFENLFFNKKEDFIKKIDFFENNKDYYLKHGIPRTLGIALSGSPGTGKTSIIKALANKLNRHLVVIPLNKIKTVEELYEHFYELTYNKNNKKNTITFDKKIIVLEDIDCMSDIVKSRDNTNKKNESDSDSSTSESKSKFKKYFKKSFNKDEVKITLSDILNLIDGINETPGRILILTSNKYEELDTALIRPGRIDYHLCMSNADKKTINNFYNYYYGEWMDDDTINNIPDFKFSPASLINYLFLVNDKEEFKKKLLE